jgi:hypothetical protein
MKPARSSHDLITQITGKWPLPWMYALMQLQNTVSTKLFITYFTGKRLFSTKYMPMYLQNTAI